MKVTPAQFVKLLVEYEDEFSTPTTMILDITEMKKDDIEYINNILDTDVSIYDSVFIEEVKR